MKAGLENKSIVFLFTDTQVLGRIGGGTRGCRDGPIHMV